MVDEVIARTKVTTKAVSVDDDYASAKNKKDLEDRNIEVIRINGAKGRALTSPDDWDSVIFSEARDKRSAVKSLMYTLKHAFDFGEVPGEDCRPYMPSGWRRHSPTTSASPYAYVARLLTRPSTPRNKPPPEATPRPSQQNRLTRRPEGPDLFRPRPSHSMPFVPGFVHADLRVSASPVLRRGPPTWRRPSIPT